MTILIVIFGGDLHLFVPDSAPHRHFCTEFTSFCPRLRSSQTFMLEYNLYLSLKTVLMDIFINHFHLMSLINPFLQRILHHVPIDAQESKSN